MKTLIDSRTAHTFETSPQRIISLVPQTELLYDLGQEDKIIGITKFCVHPYHFRSTKSVLAVPKKYITKKSVCLNPILSFAIRKKTLKKLLKD
jgi:hypothetical protein